MIELGRWRQGERLRGKLIGKTKMGKAEMVQSTQPNHTQNLELKTNKAIQITPRRNGLRTPNIDLVIEANAHINSRDKLG